MLRLKGRNVARLNGYMSNGQVSVTTSDDYSTSRTRRLISFVKEASPELLQEKLDELPGRLAKEVLGPILLEFAKALWRSRKS